MQGLSTATSATRAFSQPSRRRPTALTSDFILVVDDSTVSRMVVCGALMEAGLLVETARGGKEALDMIERRLPAMVITDVTMPDIDGFELLARLRRTLPDLPVVMLTVDADIDARVRALQLGACGVLRKSPDHAPMLALVRKLLERTR